MAHRYELNYEVWQTDRDICLAALKYPDNAKTLARMYIRDGILNIEVRHINGTVIPL